MTEQQSVLLQDDKRLRKGVFPAPQIWVEKSQEYLSKVFGENWHEYCIWDCCCGTGNILSLKLFSQSVSQLVAMAQSPEQQTEPHVKEILCFSCTVLTAHSKDSS